MKKTIVFVSAAVMLLTLAACGSTKSPSSSEPSSVSQSAPASLPATDSSSADPVAETMIEGTITDATMNSIVIKTADGVTLSFGTADADKTANDGLLIDSKVRIYYTGVITGEDTTQAVVTRMEQDKAAPSESTASTELTPESETSSIAEPTPSSESSSIAK